MEIGYVIVLHCGYIFLVLNIIIIILNIIIIINFNNNMNLTIAECRSRQQYQSFLMNRFICSLSRLSFDLLVCYFLNSF